MPTTWILTANRSKARILEMQKLHDPLLEVADFVDPAGRAQAREVNTDASGRFYGKGEHVQGHSTSTEVSTTQHEAERFAEQLRAYLHHAHTEHRFDKLWIVAAPAFLGVLRDKLPKELLAVTELEVNKDVPTATPDEIRDTALKERERQEERREARERRE
jgi:protein required for attachment to host cells